MKEVWLSGTKKRDINTRRQKVKRKKKRDEGMIISGSMWGADREE